VADLDAIPPEADWTELAMCRGKTHLFHDGKRESEGQRSRREELAKKYCAVCPVIEVCRTMGRLGREHGIWGGETDEERAAAGYLPTRSTSRRIRAAWRPQAATAADGAASPPADVDREAGSRGAA
jgi:WhiB family redox-sensing transcriptional regulator